MTWRMNVPVHHRIGVTLVFLVCACGPAAEDPHQGLPVSVEIAVETDDPEIREAVSDALVQVETAPADPAAWFRLGRTLQANGLYAGAERAYNNLLDLQHTHRQAIYLKAVSQYRQGRLSEAVTTLEALSDAGSTDAAMERALALWSLESGNLERAGTSAARAIELEPRSRGGHALLARYFIESGQPAAACTHLKPLVERPIRHSYIDFLYATALMADGRTAEAQNYMPGTPPKRPLWPDPHIEAVEGLAAGYPEALKETKAWYDDGEIQRALQRAEELYNRKPDSVAAAILYALCLRDSGRFDNAFGVLTRELDRRPRHPELLYQAAAVLTMAAQRSGSGEQLPAALALAESAIEVDPHRHESHGVAGAVLLWMGRLDDALAAFQRCAEIEPISPANCPTKVGNVMIMLGQIDEGLAVLHDAVSRQPLEAAPNVTYAMQLQAAGRRDELEALMEQLRAGGSISAGLLDEVERALASGAEIKPPHLTGGASN